MQVILFRMNDISVVQCDKYIRSQPEDVIDINLSVRVNEKNNTSNNSQMYISAIPTLPFMPFLHVLDYKLALATVSFNKISSQTALIIKTYCF